MAEWEYAVRMDFSTLWEVLRSGTENVASWEFVCRCYTVAEVGAVIPNEKTGVSQTGHGLGFRTYRAAQEGVRQEP